MQRHLTVCVHSNFTVFRCFFAAYCNCIVDNLQFRFRYDYFINHACYFAASNRLVHEYHHDFNFCFKLCYYFSSLRCIDVHHYVFRLFDYCFQFSIVRIYRFTCFISYEFDLHLCQIFNFLISWFLEVRYFNFLYWTKHFMHFVQYSIYLCELLLAILDFLRQLHHQLVSIQILCCIQIQVQFNSILRWIWYECSLSCRMLFQ